MNKSQIFLSVGALALVAILYQLPRVVVENDQLQEVAASIESHGMEIPPDVRSRMLELRRLMGEEENVDKKLNFAHSLASYYLDYGVLDSAVTLGEGMERLQNEPSELVADVYFKAFERSQSQSEAKEFSEKAKSVLEKLLDKDPSNLLLKNKLAMTLVTSENPMTGIALLREVLAADENNRQAILNLGLLSIQSGQFDRARERFEKLVSLDASDQEARLYLAVSMIEINEQSQAKLLLEEILSSKDSIPAIKMMATDYLKGL
ncbi:MAG: tetratricopeptide repeat protein [Cyclobacteriaceae bacterium]